MVFSAVHAHYDLLLVAASIAVAILGSYTALDLAGQARTSPNRPAAWLGGAALALGASIWSMHFIGMLALRLPIAVSYDGALTALSFALAVAVSGAGLFAVARGMPRRLTLPVAGTLAGLGIVSMHYVGMASMQMGAHLNYDAAMVVASVVIAVAASTAALWLAFRTQRLWQRLLGAVVMGLAVVSMHYIGMSAAIFMPAAEHAVPVATGALSTPVLATVVGAGTLALLGLALTSALLDRRWASERAAGLEARYGAVVNSAVDPIVVIDEDGIVVSYNPAAERTFGFTAEEAVGRNVSLLMPGPYKEAHDGFLAHYRRTGERRIIGIGREVQGQRKDGSVFPLELSVAEWRDGGRRYFTGIMRDVSDRKAFEDALVQAKNEAEQAREQALRAKERAERADVAKSKFLAAASHDLRQPIQSLFFFAYTLSEKLRDHPASQTLASMGESLDALRVLLDSLLDVSRLDAGVIKPNVTEFALAPLLERLQTEYTPRAAEIGLSLRLVNTRAWTRTDPVLLERILRNLIENALRYTRRGGILVGCRRTADGGLRIAVVDSGIGIPADRQADIFEEFTQLGNPERDRRKGLGLGLAIVQRLAQLLGHRVTVRSRPEHGSAFTLELPRIAARALPKPVRADVPSNASARGLILVIEDDAVVLLSMRALLEEWGYEVVAAMSSEEAVGTLLDLGRQPQAIVADYRLRDERTGVEAIRDVFGVCGVRVPAIVLTGDTSPERIREAQMSGYDLLHKPVSPNQLKDLLSKAA